MTTVVQCPICGTEVPWTEASRWRPFCSERCKLIDLGDWASERHAIPGESLAPAPTDAPKPDQAH
jgi:endogenous inhibitor of DNA gyrase (YacG/DUF329 family)